MARARARARPSYAVGSSRLLRDVRSCYASILPSSDREGRVIAEPEYLKGNVFRWSDFTSKKSLRVSGP